MVSLPLTPRGFADIFRFTGGGDTAPAPVSAPPAKKTSYRPGDRIHRDWVKVECDANGVSNHIYDIPAQGQTKADVLFIPGCGSDSVLFPRQINHHFARNGFRTLAARQIHRGEHDDNVSQNAAFMHWLFMDEDSPVYTRRTDGVPLFVVSHSSTVMLIDKIALESPEHARRINDLALHYFDAGQFYDTHLSSLVPQFQSASFKERLARRTLSALYAGYAQMAWNKPVGSTWIDKGFLRLSGADKSQKSISVSLVKGPTHGEGIQYRRLGREVLRELERLSLEDPAHPVFERRRTSFHGLSDPASSIKVSAYVDFLKSAHTERVECEAEHNPIKENAAVMPYILATIHGYLEQHVPRVQRAARRPAESAQAALASPLNAEQAL